MIEGRPCPACCRVAQSAVGWKGRRYVIRIGGPGVVHLMTAVAGRRQSRVIVVNVARRAGHRNVRTRQREGRVVVIEGCTCPADRRVTQGAIGGKRRRYVIRIGGPRIVSLVAAVTGRRQSRVVVVDVAR